MCDKNRARPVQAQPAGTMWASSPTTQKRWVALVGEAFRLPYDFDEIRTQLKRLLIITHPECGKSVGFAHRGGEPSPGNPPYLDLYSYPTDLPGQRNPPTRWGDSFVLPGSETHRKMYFRMNRTARMYISGLTFLPLPVTRFRIT